jgi:hypothetical protein
MASLYTETVSDILQRISDYRGETTVNTDAKRIRAISRSEIFLARRKLWTLFYLPDQTITSTGVATYTIGSASYPMRNKGMTDLFVGDQLESSRYQIVEAKEFRELYNQNNAENLAYVYYDAANDLWKITISPTPEDGVTIYYSYHWLPPKRTATTDDVVCIDMEALARYSLADIYDGEDEGELAAIERNKAEQLINEAMGIDDSPSEAQQFVVEGENSIGE